MESAKLSLWIRSKAVAHRSFLNIPFTSSSVDTLSTAPRLAKIAKSRFSKSTKSSSFEVALPSSSLSKSCIKGGFGFDAR